jgi:leader peptidase (prepilin peptidase)/N-methyltransferase
MTSFILFCLGASMGSFLTCVAVRSIKKKDWVKSRSVCDFCHKPLVFFDLIPIISFVVSFGKSRCCGKRLSFLYPLSEIIVGFSFLFVGWNFFPITDLVTGVQMSIVVGIISLLWIIFVTDLLYEIIPLDILVISLFLSFGFLFLHSPSCISLSPSLCFTFLWPHVLSGLIPALLFFFLWLFSHGKAMGDGDISLVFVLGLLIGYPSIVVALYVAFLTGAITGVILMLIHKKSLKSHISFGPFLIAGAGVGALWGAPIIQFVTRLWF